MTVGRHRRRRPSFGRRLLVSIGTAVAVLTTSLAGLTAGLAVVYIHATI